MKTFYEFVEYKKLNSLKEQAANLMVELDLDPAEFVMDYVAKKPKLEAALLEYIEMQEGFMDTLKNVGNAAMQFGRNVWSGGGVKGGWNQAKDTVMGPVAKFNTAIKVLNDLIGSIQKNPQTKDMVAGEDDHHAWAKGRKIADYLQDIVNQLNKQKTYIPQMQQHPTFDKPQMVQPGATPSPPPPPTPTP